MPTNNPINEEVKIHDPFDIPQSGIMNIEKKDPNDEILKNVMMLFSRVKKHTTSVPTYTPKNFGEQIVLYSSGGTYKLYIYIDGAWRSITAS